MSKQIVQLQNAIKAAPLASLLHSTAGIIVIVEQLQNTINQRDIVRFTDSGFDINMNKMIKNRSYIITFEDSVYRIAKNNSNELVINELL